MSMPLPEPREPHTHTGLRFLDYLDFYRSAVAAKVSGLDDHQLRRTCLPSGWTPIQLVNHLAFMERRWLVWGFRGEQVEGPWGDQDDAGVWRVAPDRSLDDVLQALAAGGEVTRAVVQESSLTDTARVGGRFATEDEAPTLEWILFHVLQEYARHAGHLDVVRELIDGTTGED